MLDPVPVLFCLPLDLIIFKTWIITDVESRLDVGSARLSGEIWYLNPSTHSFFPLVS